MLLALEAFIVGVLGQMAADLLTNSPNVDPFTAAGQHQIVTAIFFAFLARLAATSKVTSKVTRNKV